jgi:putative hydrolase of the HAD superfamily
MIARPQAILFDWGGTLVHTERERDTFAPGIAGIVRALRASGVSVAASASDNLHRRFVEAWARNDSVENLHEFDSVAFLRGWAGDERIELPESLDAAVDAMWRPWVGCLKPIGDVPGTLARLRSAGITLGLVSNCATVPHVCRIELARLGIADLLAFTVISSELGVRKPHPRVYQTACERALHAVNGHVSNEASPADLLFVGDTPYADIDGPARVGMKTALVRTGSWGGDTAELAHPPDLIVDSIHDLPAIWS